MDPETHMRNYYRNFLANPKMDLILDFMQKTYEIVDDPSTDSIISWGANGESFIIWRPEELAKDLLPRLLGTTSLKRFETYGFRKVDDFGGILEFANDDFVKGQPKRAEKISERYTERMKKNADPIVDQVRNAKSKEEVDFLLKEHKERTDRKYKERMDKSLAIELKDVMQRIAREVESRGGANLLQVLKDQLQLLATEDNERDNLPHALEDLMQHVAI